MARRCSGRRTACRAAPAPSSIPISLTGHADVVIRKGSHPHIDSYSAFFENDRTTPTGLAGYLRERGVTDVWLAGIATDFCVHYSALDAVSARLLRRRCSMTPAARSTSTGRYAAAMAAMREAGVRLGPHRRSRGVARHDRHRDAGLRPRLAHRPDRALAARHRLLQAPDAADGVPAAPGRHGRVQPDQPLEGRAARRSSSTRTTFARSSTISARCGSAAANRPGCGATPSTASAGCSGRSSCSGSRTSACPNTG